MIRLFVGLSLPEETGRALHALAGGIPGARWIEPENMHLTLRFIGDVEESSFGDIDAALSRVSAACFEMEIAGVGEFSRGRRPAMVWAGVEAVPPLIDLQRRIEAAAVRAGFPPEGRRFLPHITLARIKNGARGRVRAFVEEHGLLRLGPIPVGAFHLYSSHLGRRGASYRPEASYPLSAAQPAATQEASP